MSALGLRPARTCRHWTTALLVWAIFVPPLPLAAQEGAPAAASAAAAGDDSAATPAEQPDVQRPQREVEVQTEQANKELSETELAAARAEAAERFQRGLSFYADGDYRLALIEFDRAYQLIPDYRVLYNIGQVSIQLGRFARARTALEGYLKEGEGELDPSRVAAVERDLAMLRERTSLLSISAPEGSEVTVDDVLVGTTPLDEPLLVDAGDHRVEVDKPGYERWTRRVTVAGAEELSLTATLEKKQEQVVIVQNDPTPVQAPLPQDRPSSASAPPATNTPLIVSWSATGVLAVGAIVTGATGMVHVSDLDALQSEPAPAGQEEEALASRQAKAEQASNWFLATDILAASAVVAAGVSLYLTLKPAPQAPEAATRSTVRVTSVVLSPGHLFVRGQF